MRADGEIRQIFIPSICDLMRGASGRWARDTIARFERNHGVSIAQHTRARQNVERFVFELVVVKWAHGSPAWHAAQADAELTPVGLHERRQVAVVATVVVSAQVGFLGDIASVYDRVPELGHGPMILARAQAEQGMSASFR